MALKEPVLGMNSDDIEKGFAELRAENAELRSKIAALEERGGRKILPPPRPDEEGTKVTYLAPISSSTMPNDDELRELAEIVCAKYPAFWDCSNMGIHRASREENEAEWFKQFKASFRALGAMRRLESPDRKHYWHHHKDTAEYILRATGRPETLSFNPFMCACLAAGDVQFSGVGIDGAIVEIGLSEYIGRQASDVPWKHVLETGELLPMSPVRVPLAPPSPARVVVGNHSW
jgi:hypothetical protein